MGNNPDDLLTPSVVAKILDCSVDHVRDLGDNNTLPMLLTSTGRRLFKRADVEDLAARRALMPRRRNGALLSRHRAA